MMYLFLILFSQGGYSLDVSSDCANALKKHLQENPEKNGFYPVGINYVDKSVIESNGNQPDTVSVQKIFAAKKNGPNITLFVKSKDSDEVQMYTISGVGSDKEIKNLNLPGLKNKYDYGTRRNKEVDCVVDISVGPPLIVTAAGTLNTSVRDEKHKVESRGGKVAKDLYDKFIEDELLPNSGPKEKSICNPANPSGSQEPSRARGG